MGSTDRKRRLYKDQYGNARLQPKEFGDGTYRGSNGGGKGWSTDPDTGVQTMPPKWAEYLELLLGEEQLTYAEASAKLDVHPDTLKRIKRDKRFRRVWEERAAELNVSVEKVQDVVAAMHRRATQGDVKAASLYLQYVQRFMPQTRVIMNQEPSVSDLSDDELVDALQGEIAQLRAVPD
jgi:hypothetical protein